MELVIDWILARADVGLGAVAVVLLYQFKTTVKNGFADVAAAQRETNTKVDNHEARIVKLEAR